MDRIILDGFRNILALLVAEFLLVYPVLDRKRMMPLKFALGCVIGIGVSAIYILFYMYVPVSYLFYCSAFWYLIIAVYVGAVIYICFKIKITELLWSMITAYAISHIVYIIIYEFIVTDALSGTTSMFYLALGMYVLTCAAVYAVFFLAFRNKFKYLFNFSISDSPRNIILFALLYLIFIATTLINQYNVIESAEFHYLGAISDLIVCVFTLALQITLLQLSHNILEKRLSAAMLEAEKKQYAAFKNSVDYINIKVHDLKHEIGLLKSGAAVNSDRLAEVADNVAIYEAFAKTGNENLDMVITEKNLLCIKDSINFTYMADASMLSGVSPDEILSLFGNLLDNAIEFERKVEDVGKRFIRLFIKPYGNLLMIHCENYFDGTLQFRDGLPVTTKSDMTEHGFGTMSIRNTVKRYGGKVSMTAGDGLFKTEIMLKAG